VSSSVNADLEISIFPLCIVRWFMLSNNLGFFLSRLLYA
jgi:hypothetical protein